MRRALFAISLLLALGSTDARKPGGKRPGKGPGKKPSNDEDTTEPIDITQIGEDDVKIVEDCSLEEFVLWASEFGKSYDNTKQFNRHYKKWCKTDQMVKENEKGFTGKQNELRLKHNRFSATLEEERQALGRLSETPEGAELSYGTNGRLLNAEGERNLQTNTTAYDWVAANKVVAVKDQGICGSCYAFSGNSALESHIAIKENKDPVHLSEQEIVDCSPNNFGCNGGLEIYNWAYQRDNGATSNAEYPYVSGTRRSANTSCERGTKPSVAEVTGWGQMQGAQAIIDALADGPVAIGIQGENQAFYNYSGGILTSSNCKFRRMDHAVVVTGYYPGADDGTTTEPEVITTTTTRCKRKRKSRRRRSRGCNTRGGWYENETQPWLCCKDITTTEVIEASTDAYFTIQNSWGTGWGESGFVRMAVEYTGWGACGINYRPIWVTGNSVTA